MFALSAEEWEIIRLSLKVAVWSVACSLPLAVMVAFLLARSSFPGKSLFDAVVHLPLVLPPVVVGYFLLLLLGRRGPLGALLDEYFGIVVAFRWSGAAIAAGIMGFPLMVRAIRLSIEAIDSGLEDAARTLGATRLKVFFSITLPLMLPGVLSGCVVAFAASLGEFGAVITFVSNIPGETQTLPLAIYAAVQTPDGDAAAARLAVISLCLALAGLVVSELIARRARRMLGTVAKR